ncbi:(4Fe-4S)-binding protein [Chitinophaga barathri]|uniref:(4Fe-4S)-binding protein n=1 Tax=Chitinophaga barathri TaxID=1647451 RepID=A0A3N4MSA9_9BACT|nr:(4Fe-4S)-binding protein [Chitinophaga barathri]RPD38283.1 (4Fe-4S)-binding protein [Chitinophaga barathri]
MEAKVEYTNGEVTVVWQPHICRHTGICVRGLPQVFQPQERPWIKVANAATDAIIAQVQKCPSGALSFYMNADKPEPKPE